MEHVHLVYDQVTLKDGPRWNSFANNMEGLHLENAQGPWGLWQADGISLSFPRILV